jgi:fatty-acyl-CoA synthase
VFAGYGSSENAIVLMPAPAAKRTALGTAPPDDDIVVVNQETAEECPPARFDEHGRLLNGDEAIGELVNTQGAGFFAGYYNDPQADADRMRGGMYWSGDLAYRDADGFVYFAGRTADWLRVDGENLAAAPIERVLLRHPAVQQAAVYAAPDPSGVGDQVMAALVLRDGAVLDPAGLEAFLAGQADLGSKSWPRWVRLARSLPQTPTNKVLKRRLAEERLETADPVWERADRGTTYHPR